LIAINCLIARQAGLRCDLESSPQLFLISNKDSQMSINRPHIDLVRASLKRHAKYLQDSIHDEIARGLVTDGLASDGGGVSLHAVAASGHAGHGHPRVLTAIEASSVDPQRAAAVRTVVSEASRLGFSNWDLGKPLDMHAFSNAVKDAPVLQRMRIKEKMYRLGLCEA
jgi:hypothetical protein